MTERETDDARDVRHELQLTRILDRAPDLPAALTLQVLRASDDMADEHRRLRASFMLGELSEDDYVEARRDATRQAFQRFREILSPEQFAEVFQWDSEADPYDRDGSLLPARPAPPAPAAPATDVAPM